MGCGCSSEGANSTNAVEEAKKQRRRLSVAPQSVGNINTLRGAPDNDIYHLKENLTEVETKAKGNLKIGVHSRKGFIPYNTSKMNQDRPILKYALAENANLNLFGALDGHGEHGHLVSEFAMKQIVEYLAKEKDIETDTGKAMIEGIAKMCDALDLRHEINCTYSGTTCIVSVLKQVGDERRLITGNIGDSRCCIAKINKDGTITAVPQSYDQKPENPGEKERILAAGGRVAPLPQNHPGEDTGPHRVWLKDYDVPGLAMARSIGDKCSQTVGVISVPEIKEYVVADDDIFAVWASDGVWEFLSNEVVMELVADLLRSGRSYQEAAMELVDAAKRSWQKEEEVIDDITCVIVGFNEFPK